VCDYELAMCDFLTSGLNSMNRQLCRISLSVIVCGSFAVVVLFSYPCRVLAVDVS